MPDVPITGRDCGDEQPDAELGREEAWRMSSLLDLGFTNADASELAGYPTVSLAEARTLIGLGCPHALARRILLPV